MHAADAWWNGRDCTGPFNPCAAACRCPARSAAVIQRGARSAPRFAHHGAPSTCGPAGRGCGRRGAAREQRGVGANTSGDLLQNALLAVDARGAEGHHGASRGPAAGREWFAGRQRLHRRSRLSRQRKLQRGILPSCHLFLQRCWAVQFVGSADLKSAAPTGMVGNSVARPNRGPCCCRLAFGSGADPRLRPRLQGLLPPRPRRLPRVPGWVGLALLRQI